MTKLLLTTALLTSLAVGIMGVRADTTNAPSIFTNAPAANADAKVKPYPLDYCLVSGDKLDGDMGKPIVMDYNGQELKFCCADCPKKFKQDPEKYVKKLAEAQAKTAAEKK